LLNRYNFTEHRYRQHFHGAKPKGQKRPGQFIQLKNYFAKWVQLSEVEAKFEGVSDQMVKKQFSSSCSKELAVYLMERNSKDLEELSDLAEQYLIAHRKKLSARTSHDAKKTDAKNMAFNKDKQVLLCFSCQGVGHRAVDCPSTSKRWWRNVKTLEEKKIAGGAREMRRCYCCGETGHYQWRCRNGQRQPPPQRQGPELKEKISPPFHGAACGVQVKRLREEGISQERS